LIVLESMEPTLMTGDIIIFNKLAYEFTDVQHGDTIEFHDGYVFINGLLLDESSYLDDSVETDSFMSFTVPDRIWMTPHMQKRDQLICLN